VKDTRDELISMLTESYFALKDIVNAAHNDQPYSAEELGGFVPSILGKIDKHLGIEDYGIERYQAVEMGLIKVD
jgi:hypothetical protein